ncbi:histidine phosphatase family protein [bacterium]|nr:histidine phosphatase family protein [bacterium]MBP9807078.1 histidine phosphatase family protein [bacterium]
MDITDLTIKICRHAESKQNTGCLDIRDVGDYRIPLADEGATQALQVGRENAAFLRTPGTLFYRSPYLRVRQTMDNVLLGAGLKEPGGEPVVRVYEDPQLREVEHGYKSVDQQESMRKLHGWFYYRYEGGESPADCYDRCASFIESMMQQVRRKPGTRQIFICTHGLTARLLVMRFLYLTVEQFELLDNPYNCDVITIAPLKNLVNPQFASRRWGVVGLRVRKESEKNTPIVAEGA